MKRFFSRLSALALAVLLTVPVLAPAMAAEEQTHSATILFTHDLHSHFLPQPTENGGESGGYARLKTALDREREKYPGALTVDGGDFSIGSLIQVLYTDYAAELRTMGAMGYDAVTLGNHEFDHTGKGFAQMLLSAAQSGDPLPALVQANYRPAQENPDRAFILDAMEAYGLSEGIVLQRGGVTYGIFGLMGVDSDDCAPTSGFVLEDMAQAAKRCVADLRAQGAEFIICLSHSGTENGKGEDYELAKAVEGIDLIVSGHTHTTLAEPIVVNDTYIVSAGPYCRNLGSITLEWTGGGEKALAEYRLIPIDETLPGDPDAAGLVEDWKSLVSSTYLDRYGLTYDQVLTHTDFPLATPASGVQEGNALGELAADAFLWAAENLAAERTDGPTVTVTADGVLRASLFPGDITASQAFDVLSMGVGSDGASGFPLVEVYLTGKELKAAAEVDASVTPVMPAAQLYAAGIEYSFNPHRMFFNRVTEALLYQEDRWTEPAPILGGGAGDSGYGYTVTHIERNYSEIQDGQLYRVVSGMYSAQMLGTVKEKSMGLLSLEPKMADGSPVTDFEACILRDASGKEIKEWYALAAYLQSFGQEGLPGRYAQPDGRKVVSTSWNPVELVKNPNWITLLALAAILVILLLAAWIIRRIVRRRKKAA